MPAFPPSNYSLTSTHKFGLHALDRKLGRRIPPTSKLGDKWFAAGHGTVVSCGACRHKLQRQAAATAAATGNWELCVWMNKFSLFFTQLTPEELLRKTGDSGPSFRSGWPGRKARVLGDFVDVGGGDLDFTCEISWMWVWRKVKG